MLTGTLITIAGFVPIGFAESQAGEYTISLFQVVAIALIASWFVAVLFTPIVGVVLLRAAQGRRAADSRGRFPRALLFAPARLRDRVRWLTIAVSFGAVRRGPPRLGPASTGSSSRPPTATSSSSISSCRARARSSPARTAVERIEDWLARERGRRLLELLCRPQRHPLLSAARHPAAERPPLPDRRHGEGPRRAHAAARTIWTTSSTDTFPEAISRVSPLEMGPPIGWPLQWRLSGPDIEVLRDEACAGRGHRRSSRRASGCISTGSSRRGSCASRSTRTRRGGSA